MGSTDKKHVKMRSEVKKNALIVENATINVFIAERAVKYTFTAEKFGVTADYGRWSRGSSGLGRVEIFLDPTDFESHKKKQRSHNYCIPHPTT
jgi:hypothetical protein